MFILESRVDPWHTWTPELLGSLAKIGFFFEMETDVLNQSCNITNFYIKTKRCSWYWCIF